MRETWKRTVEGCLARLKECEDGMELERGTGLNLWSGEWSNAFEWLLTCAPRAAARLFAEAEAKAKADLNDGR